MMPLIRRYLLLGGATLAGGGLATGWGTAAMLRFVRRLAPEGRPTLDEVTKGLIVPHVFALIGAGVVVYSLILLVKAALFARQHRRERRRGAVP